VVHNSDYLVSQLRIIPEYVEGLLAVFDVPTIDVECVLVLVLACKPVHMLVEIGQEPGLVDAIIFQG
jgi:hypothetical protein